MACFTERSHRKPRYVCEQEIMNFSGHADKHSISKKPRRGEQGGEWTKAANVTKQRMNPGKIANEYWKNMHGLSHRQNTAKAGGLMGFNCKALLLIFKLKLICEKMLESKSAGQTRVAQAENESTSARTPWIGCSRHKMAPYRRRGLPLLHRSRWSVSTSAFRTVYPN